MMVSLKEAARRIREHNRIHHLDEPWNSPIITEILETAAVMFEQIDAGIYKPVIYGHWISHYDGIVEYQECSVCRKSISNSIYPYCPHCGAEMDESEGNK